MGFGHTTTRKENDVNLAGRDLTFNWGINAAKKFWAVSREMIVRKGNITFRTCAAALLRAGLAVGLVVVAAGCQQKYWYQEGKTYDECRADHEDCWAELLKRTDLRQTSSYRQRFLENCMRQKGYEPVAEKDLPLDLKRVDPEVPSDTPLVHSYGVAGALSPWPPSTSPDGAPVESAALTRGSQRSLVSPRSPPRQGSTSSSR